MMYNYFKYTYIYDSIVCLCDANIFFIIGIFFYNRISSDENIIEAEKYNAQDTHGNYEYACTF